MMIALRTHRSPDHPDPNRLHRPRHGKPRRRALQLIEPLVLSLPLDSLEQVPAQAGGPEGAGGGREEAAGGVRGGEEGVGEAGEVGEAAGEVVVFLGKEREGRRDETREEMSDLE